MNRRTRLILALGAIFVGGVAVSGCGSAVPGDSVAVVSGNPITSRTLAHWGYIAAVGQSQAQPGSPVIIPDPPNYTKCIASLRKVAPPSIAVSQIKTACQQQFAQTMEYLVRSYWVQGQAASQGITVTPAQVMAKVTAARNSSPYKSATAFAALLASNGETLSDILYRFRIIALAAKLATPSAIAAYYKAHLSSYQTAEQRNVRLIATKSLKQAQAAKAALASHHSWNATAKKYSTDPATKNTGGLLLNVTNGKEPVAVNTAIFSAAQGKLLGPISTPFGYYVVEVIKITPASTASLAKETPLIKSTLSQAALQSPPWLKKWKAKTTCRAGFTIPDCKNYVAPKTTPITTPTPTPTTPTPTTPTTTPTVTTVPTASTTTTTPTKKKK